MSNKNSKKISGASLKHAFHEIIWPRRKLIAIGLILILFNRLAGLVLPASTQYLVDDVIAQGNLRLLLSCARARGRRRRSSGGTSYSLVMLLSVEAQHLIAELRAQVQRARAPAPGAGLRQHEEGELVSRIMDDVEGVRNLVGTGLVQLVGGVITAVVALASC
jgi:ABC-type multidrug transport system fused ATPase/permease subunit